jgi:hypothetical protein
MDDTETIDVNVTRDEDESLAPRLNTAPDLLYNLGFCLAVSSTRDVARVVLPDSAPAYVASSLCSSRISGHTNPMKRSSSIYKPNPDSQ